MKPYQPALRLARPGLQELGQSRVHSSARSSGRASRRQSKPSLSHFQRVALPPQQQSAQHSRRRTSYETERQTASAVLRQYNKRTKPDDFAFSAQDVSRSFERLPYYEANPAAVVPTLRHGLEEVLKTPNTIHLLRSADAIDEVADRETSTSSAEVRHIDAPDLDIMPKYSDINMKVIAHFVPPSADPRLAALARQRLKSSLRFAGSTSSLSGPLVQIWALLNPKKDLHMDGLFSEAFASMPKDLSAGTLLPPSIKLTRKEGVWFIDADKDAIPESPNDLLTSLGHVGEKLFTTTADEFAEYKLDVKREDQEGWEQAHLDQPQAYAYSQHGGLFMRSQIDSCFSDEPHKTFDIKTRATISIRLDRLNADQGSYYQLKHQEGKLESYERENYDLMRSAYLKYSMQARIGGMAGIFIGHHNTRQIFGFQYLKLEDMDRVTSGSHEEAESMFQLCVGTLESILRRVAVPQDHPEVDQVSITFRAVSGQSELQIFREAPGLPTEMWTLSPSQLPSSENGYAVKYNIEEGNSSRAQYLRLQCLKRQKQFNVAYLPAIPELTPAQLEQVQAHNKLQELERNDRIPDDPSLEHELLQKTQETPLPFELVSGITYIYPNTAHVKALRQLAQASMLEAQANQVTSKTAASAKLS